MPILDESPTNSRGTVPCFASASLCVNFLVRSMTPRTDAAKEMASILKAKDLYDSYTGWVIVRKRPYLLNVKRDELPTHYP